MRLLVCGGRDFTDGGRVGAVLNRWHAKRPISLLIHGAARGVDTFAELWAREAQVDYRGYPARWRIDGRTVAGPIRNQRMLDDAKPDWVLAFPGGPGTAGMIKLARAAGVQVWTVGAVDPLSTKPHTLL